MLKCREEPSIVAAEADGQLAFVKVERGALGAAGTTGTRTVPADSLPVARPETVTKAGWAKKRRDEGRLK